MHVRHAREVPEYEIAPKELDFTNSVEIDKVKLTACKELMLEAHKIRKWRFCFYMIALYLYC